MLNGWIYLIYTGLLLVVEMGSWGECEWGKVRKPSPSFTALTSHARVFQGCGGNKVTIITFLRTNHLRIKRGSLEENRSMLDYMDFAPGKRAEYDG
ncbi:hypothetical protein HOY82DRAFT_550691 [Tuber indicum]|nr:hypothetical protein HOY82DRAFT_550691 [Tuber indicum]